MPCRASPRPLHPLLFADARASLSMRQAARCAETGSRNLPGAVCGICTSRPPSQRRISLRCSARRISTGLRTFISTLKQHTLQPSLQALLLSFYVNDEIKVRIRLCCAFRCRYSEHATGSRKSGSLSDARRRAELARARNEGLMRRLFSIEESRFLSEQMLFRTHGKVNI